MVSEAELIERLTPSTRLELVLQVLEWTIDALPASGRDLLVEEAGKTVDAAMGLVRRSVGGSGPEGSAGDAVVGDVIDELFEWSDDLRVERLWQLFNALSYCVEVRAADTSAALAGETLAACYDVIRDCEEIPEFPIGTPEATVLAAERANHNCMRAIARQKELVHEALRRNSDG
jgi:hypothetical protein